MAKHEQRYFTRVYHTIVAILTLLAGAGLLGLGVWLNSTGNKGLSDLDFSDFNIVDFVLRANVAAIIIGIFLIVTSIVSLIALSRNCIGITFRVIYVVLAALILVACIAVCVASIALLRNRNDSTLRGHVKDAWVATVDDTPLVICAIEKNFQCRGFLDGDCTLCKTGKEPECEGSKTFCARCERKLVNIDVSVGCYDELIAEIAGALLPAAIVSGVLAVVVFIDMLFMCCL